ncbi:winged helix-turn-helix domain-containing protein [Devosia sp.]|uniref:winged helix-turn-helix domain-containing protein n=1 Tax=Devosia sp. TaxID=1871048 RepID=UPI003BAD82D9
MKADNVVDLVFGRDLLSVTHADGALLHFTRQERALLMRLIDNAGRLLPRDVLVAAVSGEGSEPASDRHVDFLINQLRRKLRDDARSPRFIRTQYGEGYTWIGEVRQRDEKPSLLRLGSVYGEHLPGATASIVSLVAVLEDRLSSGRSASPGEACVNATKASFLLDASFHGDGQRLHAALVLRHGETSAILDTFRLVNGDGDSGAAIATIADAIVHAIWSSAALPESRTHVVPSEPPPWVRLFEAALMMDGDMLTWKSNAERLETILAGDPDNAVMEVMRGLNLYTWLIQSFYDPSGQIVGEAQWRAIEDDMEAIALANLARFERQPIMQLAVAKLLLFINRGYLQLSRQIADDVLSNSSAHAAAFALAGEAAGFAGDVERGTELLERSLELSEAGSHFQVYLLVVEASALLAANDMAGFERICRLTRDIAPNAYATLQAFCAMAGYETAPLFVYVIAPNAERAKEAIRFLWNVTGRRFMVRAHRRNFMRPLTAALVQRFGLAVIPEEVNFGTGLGAELVG